MNKTQIERLERIGNKAKLCLLGKIAADINSRLPEKPAELSNWEKYKLIRDGKAKLIKNFTVKKLMNGRYDNGPYLVEAFTYPDNGKQAEFNKAVKATENEKLTREQAVENAIDRLVNEVTCSLIDSKNFLDRLEKISAKEW
jgi:hypothetical protein